MALRPAKTAPWLVAITAVLLVFGSTVRVHGAGLSCPDWPLCFGRLVPAFDVKVYLEFGHRVLASLVSFGFLAQAIWLWRRGDLARSKWLAVLVVGGGLLLALQIVLGGLTVLHLLAEWTVASHLITGNLFCVSLFLTALALRELDRPVSREAIAKWPRYFISVIALVIPVQLVIGGLVASSHAGLACATWPGCNGTVWFPTFQGLVGLHVIHRAVAYTLAALVLGNVFVQRGRSRVPAIVLLVVVLTQAAIGITNVLLRLPVEVTLLHSAGAATAMLVAAWHLDETWRAPALQLVQRLSSPAAHPAEAK